MTSVRENVVSESNLQYRIECVKKRLQHTILSLSVDNLDKDDYDKLTVDKVCLESNLVDLEKQLGAMNSNNNNEIIPAQFLCDGDKLDAAGQCSQSVPRKDDVETNHVAEFTHVSLPDLKNIQSGYMKRLKEIRHSVKAKDKDEATAEVQKQYDNLSRKLTCVNESIRNKEDHESEIQRNIKKFNQIYLKIKKTIFALFFTYTSEIGLDCMEDISNDINELAHLQQNLVDAYDAYRSLTTPDNEARRKVDGGIQMCVDFTEVLREILQNPMMNTKHLFKKLLQKQYAASVLGSQLDIIKEHTASIKFPALEQDAQSVKSLHSINSEKLVKLAELKAKQKRADLNAKLLQHKLAQTSIEEQLKIVNEEEHMLTTSIEVEPKVPCPLSQSDMHKSQPKQVPVTSCEEKVEQVLTKSNEVEPRISGIQSQYNTHTSEPKQASVTPSCEIKSDLAYIAQSFADNVTRSRLPVPTPPIFDGNPLKFMYFKKSFVTLIENKGIAPSEKLYYLQQYLSGEAKAAVEGCFFGSDEVAYKTAWDRLEARFGNSFLIQQHLRTKLKDWPKIHYKNHKALQDFADFLNTLLEAMPYIDGLQILNDYVQIQDIATKLPEWCSNRWTRQVVTTIHAGNGYPTMKEFVDFVEMEAKIANDPISNIANSLHTQAKEKSPSIVHVVKTERQDSKMVKDNHLCAFCEHKHHSIGKCEQFSMLQHQDRIACIREKRLCFKCLCQGHISKECQAHIICDICQRNHNSLLHVDGVARISKNIMQRPEEIQQSSIAESFISNKVHQDSIHSYTSMVLPVWVKTGQSSSQEILTYALIDSQSDSCYMTDELAEKLCMPYEPTRMKNTTINSVSVEESKKYSGIKLRGFNMNTEVCLKTCYTKKYIPFNQDHIPSKKRISRIPHLAQVAPLIPPIQDCKVGLLIGYSCPQALRPIDTIYGNPEDSYAVKTDLGWSVVGPSFEEDTGCHNVSSKRLHLQRNKVNQDTLLDINKHVNYPAHLQDKMVLSTMAETELALVKDVSEAVSRDKRYKQSKIKKLSKNDPRFSKAQERKGQKKQMDTKKGNTSLQRSKSKVKKAVPTSRRTAAVPTSGRLAAVPEKEWESLPVISKRCRRSDVQQDLIIFKDVLKQKTDTRRDMLLSDKTMQDFCKVCSSKVEGQQKQELCKQKIGKRSLDPG